MAKTEDNERVKREARAVLEQSRAELSRELAHTRSMLKPRNILQYNVERHSIIMIVSVAVAGFLIARYVFAPPPIRVKAPNVEMPSKKATKKGSMAGLLAAGVWSLAKGPLLAIAKEKLLPSVSQYFSAPHASSKQQRY